jgi:hypothetical protein
VLPLRPLTVRDEEQHQETFLSASRVLGSPTLPVMPNSHHYAPKPIAGACQEANDQHPAVN